MSFDQLMQHAKDITVKAADLMAKERSGSAGVHRPEEFMPHLALLEAKFEPFSRLPDPAGYDPLIDHLNRAMEKVNTGSVAHTDLSKDIGLSNPNLDKMTSDGGYLQGWTGEGAMAFKANFVDTFKTLSGNQFTALSTMKGVLQAHQAMWLKARDDIDKIAEHTLDALDNAGGCGKNKWSFGFSVLSAVGTITGAAITIATGGATAPIVAIGAAASLGSAGVASTTASGDSVNTIMNSMTQAIDDLTKHIQEVETQQITDRVRALIDVLNGNKVKLVAARPKLAGMNDRDLIGDSGMGSPA
ncbi:hypothetical protein OG203_04495 [Nocardia sp. NBC_01499]|uniref:hypothetical protein n=1 Tax=Nocardia sp. NBC_01499 TaxID=2903597 RepID=UPI0038688F83